MTGDLRETSTNTLIELDAVRFGYRDDVDVVRDISAQLAQGRLTVLLGPNASGKSTLLRLMLGALDPKSGTVKFDGRALREYRDVDRAAQIAFVPQQTSSGFFFTVREVIEMGRFALSGDDDAFATVIADLELEDMVDSTFVELSSGQQQRVLVARALYQSSGEGRFLLLDEPVSAMDLYHVHATLRRLREVARSGRAVLVVLQDINLAAQYADDVWLMRRGELVRAGERDEVLAAKLLEEVYGVELEILETSGGDHARFEVRWK